MLPSYCGGENRKEFDATADGKVKARPSAGRMWLGRFEFLSLRRNALAIRFAQDLKHFNDSSAIRPISC
jgi:hypothetical protein